MTSAYQPIVRSADGPPSASVACAKRRGVELVRTDAREVPVEHPQLFSLEARVVRTRVEVDQRMRRAESHEALGVLPQQRQRDVEPLASLVRAATCKSRGLRELAAIGEASP